MKSIQEIQEEIIEEFKGKDVYSYLIELGKNLPSLDEKYKIEENLIKGCLVKTWFYCKIEGEKVFYFIDSNSLLIRGIIALLIRIFSGKKIQEIKKAEIFFPEGIGLKEEFLPFRENSIWKLVNQIKSVPEACKENL